MRASGESSDPFRAVEKSCDSVALRARSIEVEASSRETYNRTSFLEKDPKLMVILDGFDQHYLASDHFCNQCHQ